MEYRCEDLPQYGVILLPPSSPDYPSLAAGIQERLDHPIPGSAPYFRQFDDPDAPGIILCNRAPTAIAALAWRWRFEPETGRSTGASIATAGVPSVLAPFGLDERTRKLYGYWHTILPGSQRLVRGNSLFGDNTDVRPPEPDELWKGGGVGGGGGLRRPSGPLKSVSLALDSVFFVDGGLAGPDTLRSFDRLTADVDAHLRVAHIAREGHNQGLSAAAILAQVEAVTGSDRGPAPPPPPDHAGDFLPASLRTLASQIGMMRQHGGGDDRVVYLLMSWTETPLPNFRKL